MNLGGEREKNNAIPSFPGPLPFPSLLVPFVSPARNRNGRDEKALAKEKRKGRTSLGAKKTEKMAGVQKQQQEKKK